MKWGKEDEGCWQTVSFLIEIAITADEIAFYNALAENESAVEAMGNDSLKIIAHELLMSLKLNITVD